MRKLETDILPREIYFSHTDKITDVGFRFDLDDRRTAHPMKNG
jgi:hypothetical protein